MSNTQVYYEHTRPRLAIERNGGSQLGNCYYESRWRFTSTSPLTPERVNALIDAEGMRANAGVDIKGGTEPAGFDITPPVEEDRRTHEIVSRTPINPYSGKPYEMKSAPFYVADVAIRVDSGD